MAQALGGYRIEKAGKYQRLAQYRLSRTCTAPAGVPGVPGAPPHPPENLLSPIPRLSEKVHEVHEVHQNEVVVSEESQAGHVPRGVGDEGYANDTLVRAVKDLGGKTVEVETPNGSVVVPF